MIAAGKKTGIGEGLDELQKLFKAIEFPLVMGLAGKRERDNKVAEAAIASPALKVFVKQLGVVTKLADTHAKDFKSSTFKKTAEALADIGEAAEAVKEVCSEKHLRECLEAAFANVVNKKFETLKKEAGLLIESRDAVLNKIPDAIKNIKELLERYAMDRKRPSGQLVGGAISKLARDMTQVLFNLEKLEQGATRCKNSTRSRPQWFERGSNNGETSKPP